MQAQPMVGMANMNNAVGPVDGTPVMGNGPRRQASKSLEPREMLNTYIFDYFVRNNHPRLARMMIECDLKLNVSPSQKSSPGNRNVNGVDAMDQDSKDDLLPTPNIPPQQATENSFLLDWWVQFWDIFGAARGHGGKGAQYIAHARNLTQMQTDHRNQRMMMNPQYQSMMRSLPNGVAPNELKRAAAMNNRPNANPMANMNQMKNQPMMSAQMQREGSQMDMNGQRPQSPGSNENGQSPNKRPRVEGGMGAPGSQFEFSQQAQNVQQKQMEGMNAGVQGSPMSQHLEGQNDLFTGNQPRPGMPTGGPPGPPQGNHALQDYQMQLMLLEQQNKKRLLMARQEQDNMSGPHAQAAVGAPGFPPSMSPQGSRAGPSPNPTDQMKKGTPRMGPQGLPGSPMPEGVMQQQRNSPTPNVSGFDPNQMPPMPPQYGFPGQMPNTAMMRPPSSHPGNFNGQQLTPQQMEAMQRNGMPNGVWRGPQGQPGVMPNQQQMGPMGNNPQQRGQMAPPPAPASDQPRTQEPSPSQSAQAPPTPSQGNKPNPKKKATKDNKKAASKQKGPATGATPATSGGEEPPNPSTPVTPMHSKPFGQNGQQQPPQQATQPQPPTQPQPQQQQQAPPMENSAGSGPFGNIADDANFGDLGLGFDDSNALENFDFDSFLHVGDDSGTFGSLGTEFGFGDGVEAGGDL